VSSASLNIVFLSFVIPAPIYTRAGFARELQSFCNLLVGHSIKKLNNIILYLDWKQKGAKLFLIILLRNPPSLWFDRIVVNTHIEKSVSNTARSNLKHASGGENEDD
jgi:hypothetical protein